MCTLYTYTNTYMPKFSSSGLFGPTRCLVPTPELTFFSTHLPHPLAKSIRLWGVRRHCTGWHIVSRTLKVKSLVCLICVVWCKCTCLYVPTKMTTSHYTYFVYTTKVRYDACFALCHVVSIFLKDFDNLCASQVFLSYPSSVFVFLPCLSLLCTSVHILRHALSKTQSQAARASQVRHHYPTLAMCAVCAFCLDCLICVCVV